MTPPPTEPDPPGDPAPSGSPGPTATAAPPAPPVTLPHLDGTGAARMVDVGDKATTVRSATARGRLLVSPPVVALLRGAGVPKGDALAVARIAAVMGAKRTADLIPLCHPVALAGTAVTLRVADDAVHIEVTCRCADRTGVEMEALTAVAVAGLALHDMVKAVDPAAVLGDIRLVAKSGGRSGTWLRAGEDPPSQHDPEAR